MASVGASVASDRDAKLSIMRFTHSCNHKTSHSLKRRYCKSITDSIAKLDTAGMKTKKEEDAEKSGSHHLHCG